MRKYLEEVNLDLLVGNQDSCEEKSNTLKTVIKTGMDILLPLKSKKVPANERPWINKKLKSLIQDRQSALSRGDNTNFRHLRNSVNRYRKSCRSKYYAAKVEHLRDCEPRSKSASESGPPGPIGLPPRIWPPPLFSRYIHL